jgi:hypothetical protein
MQGPQRDSTGMDSLDQAKVISVGRGPEREGPCIMDLAGVTILPVPYVGKG